ncbi:MAG: hypothetical protein L6R42_001100 [Xanthoria sp. 1 TBL-2021]|nr:MAG: hypothetical protein L6R42_001100 [Xanthoria sp. 1 TBL-2021]
MDAASVAERLFTASAAGSQLAVNVYTLASYVDNPDPHVKDIGDDILSTSTVLQLLGRSLTQDVNNNDKSILNQLALKTLQGSATLCEKIFREIDRATTTTLKESIASIVKQKARSKARSGGEPKLEGIKEGIKKANRALLQLDENQMAQLYEVKATLLLISGVENLAWSPKAAATLVSPIHDQSLLSSDFWTTPSDATASSDWSVQRDIYQISLALERQTHNRADDRLEHLKYGRSDDKTAKQTHPRSFVTASSLEEEVTLTPLEGSFTTLPGDGVSCPPVTHALAVEFPSQKGESSAAAKARPSPAETQHDTNEDSFPQGSSNNTPSGRVDENKSQKGTRLHLFHIQPFVRDDNGGIFLNWTANELLVSQSDIQDHLDKTLREGLPTGDPNYMIIRTWLNESDQEILFEHTRKLRESQKGKSDFSNKPDKHEEEDDNSPLPREGKKDVIVLKDAISRTLVFPFHMCNTWAGISELITEAFRPIRSLDPWVAVGHYDLLSARGEIILPKVWHSIIEPGAAIAMHMWPKPEGHPTMEDSAPEAPVPGIAHLTTIAEGHSEHGDETAKDNAGHGDLGEDHSTSGTVLEDMEVESTVRKLLRK